MHAGEVAIDADLVRRLVDEQFPQWASLPLERVASYGTDHAIFRLGADLSVRLPRIDWATGQADHERKWLPRLAPHLPVELPLPVCTGVPAHGYPWAWSVVRWLEGEPAPFGGSSGLADDVARFLHALRVVDVDGAPAPRGRGRPLAELDERLRGNLSNLLPNEADADAVLAVWEDAVAAPAWEGPPTWLHGDVQVGNLLLRDGRLTGVIDWGSSCAGDPACDLFCAWTIFDEQTRPAFRAAMDDDDASWRRARGWVVLTAVNAITYYRHTNPGMVAEARWRFRQVLV